MKTLAALILSCASIGAFAQQNVPQCPNLTPSVNKARDLVRAITMEQNLPAARKKADEASAALQSASTEIFNCGCPAGGSDFGRASDIIGNAATAVTLEEFMPRVDTGVQSYNSGIQSLNRCAAGA